ncbi:MAG TPA: carbohydrate binding domain-containing protein, partial [Polyangiaceae bacterium]|nr:carbohydrate binding domain-containing protein [Polyangiaceae bacterium]
IDVSAVGTEAWHVQLFQSGLALVPGETYAARLRARASSARPVSFDVLLAAAPWTTFTPWTDRTLTTEWQDLWSTFTVPEGEAPGEVRFQLGMLGLQTGTVWVSQASLTQGTAPLEVGESLEAGTIPLVAHDSPRAWSRAARRDFVAFLRDTERAYYDALASTLRDELGVRALISGSQVITSPPTVQAALDVVDNHAYWDNMIFPGEPWDPVDWSITNTSVVGSPPGIFGTLASGRVAGKPYIVSETNHQLPNTYASEGPLLTAAYAALQDFDGVFFFQWRTERNLDHRTFLSYNDTGYHAPLLASLAAAAPLFQGFDVSPAAGAFTVAMDPDAELEAIVDAGVDWNVVDARCRGFPAAAALLGRVELDVSPGAVDSPVPDLAGQTRFVSDTGELVWDAAAGVVTIDSARARAVIGSADGGSFALGGPGLDCASQPEACVTFEIGATRQGFCALALTLLEGASFAADGRALISATGDVENTGMVWTDASRTSVGDDWGGAPTLVEVIPAVVTLPRAASEVRVFALDGRGQRAAELPVTGDGAAATFELGQELDTLWYEVVLGAAGDPPGDGESSLTACAAVCDAAAAAVPGCYPRRADCVSECSRLYVDLRSAPCDCAEAADTLLACAGAAPAALACSELPLGLDSAGDCLDELVAAEQCAGAVRPCVAYERELIDDFEDGDARALHPEFGVWVLDGDAASTLAPVPFTPTAGGVHASAHAARVNGDVAEWAGLGLASHDGAPLDLSAYVGIAFFARGAGVTRVAFQGSALSAAENWDAHGMDLSLEDEWRYFTVLFGDHRFAQQGWGDPAAFDPAAIDQLHFAHGPGPWQLELDDVTLLRDQESGSAG